MSLNKTLNRLFDEVRREAKRNPAFADRLEAAIRAHVSAREIDESNLDVETGPPAPSPASVSRPAPTPSERSADAGEGAGGPPHADLNPVAYFTRDGADALQAALSDLPESALAHLVSEHNLDPAGAAAGLPKPDLVAHIVAQAQKRVERDRKLFDY